MIIPNFYRIIKKIVAITVVFMVFIKVLIIDTFALSVAPIMGEALVEVFASLLVGSGAYTAEDVNDMSWAEVENAVYSGVSSGTINPVDVVGTVTVNGIETQMNFIEWFALNAKFTSDVITSDVFGTITDVAVKTTLQNYVPVTIGNWFNTLTAEDVVCTPVIDMQGFGAMAKGVSSTGKETAYYYYADYIVLNFTSDINGVMYFYSDNNVRSVYINSDGEVGYDKYVDSGSKAGFHTSDYAITYTFYGDVRYQDGTAYPTGEATTAEVGETADGEKVTLDDIQSGAVSLDDTTVDYDAFDDDAIIDLLQQILTELEQVPVVKEDSATVDSSKETVADMAAELDIAELNNLQMPIGISDVFPFCLPFDFVRGMELLVADPEVPVFKTVIDFGEINGWDLGEYPVEISFEKWESVAIVTRWTSLLLFSYVLIFISTKIVKGAGA